MLSLVVCHCPDTCVILEGTGFREHHNWLYVVLELPSVGKVVISYWTSGNWLTYCREAGSIGLYQQLNIQFVHKINVSVCFVEKGMVFHANFNCIIIIHCSLRLWLRGKVHSYTVYISISLLFCQPCTHAGFAWNYNKSVPKFFYISIQVTSDWMTLLSVVPLKYQYDKVISISSHTLKQESSNAVWMCMGLSFMLTWEVIGSVLWSSSLQSMEYLNTHISVWTMTMILLATISPIVDYTE